MPFNVRSGETKRRWACHDPVMDSEGRTKCGVGLRERPGPSGVWQRVTGRPAERTGNPSRAGRESNREPLAGSGRKGPRGEFQDFTLKRGEGRPPQGRIAQWVHAAECNLADIEGRVCPARAALGHRRAGAPPSCWRKSAGAPLSRKQNQRHREA